MNKKLSSLLEIIIFSLVIVIIFEGGRCHGKHESENLYKHNVKELAVQAASRAFQDKLLQTAYLISREYVDSISVDSLEEMILPMLLEKLDPHSTYLPAKLFSEEEEPLVGEFDGIGVVFNMATDTVVVLNVIPGGPSQKAGIMGGDRIMRANDTLLSGLKMSTNKVMKHLRGKRGSKVKLTIQRPGIKDSIDIVVTRDAIPIHSVEASVMMSPEIGFIKLSRFSRTSYTEVCSAIDTLRQHGMKKLIFDLRGNSGGFLDQAILIANEFLPKNKLIVYTEGRQQEQLRTNSTGTGRAQDIPLVILIDELSASSSEILAGAIQDNDRGTIIGRRSFGKGLVQSQHSFADGSAIRLTIARYFTATGRCIQKPYTLGNDEDYEMDLVNRIYRNELFSRDSIHFADSLKYTTPKGKTVYGGGGIMPDIFVPLDTLNMSKYYREVTGRNILYRYTLDFTDAHRKELSKIQTLKELIEYFNSNGRIFDEFVTYAQKKGVAPKQAQINISRKLMEQQIKAYIARNTEIGDGAFYYFISPIDKTVQEALSILRKERYPLAD